MANATIKYGEGNWAIGENVALAYNDTNNNFKPLPFNFTRGSEATFVNRQGLIESTNVIGEEEIQNGSFQLGSELVIGGDFSNPSDWLLIGLNLSISNGKGISTGSNFGAQFTQAILTPNRTYKLTFDIVDYTSGEIGTTSSYYGETNLFNSVGTHTAIFTSLSQTDLKLYSQNFIGSIDNVSVKEVPNWILDGGWSISGGKATQDGTNGDLEQTSLVTGLSYKVTLEVSNYVQGALVVRLGAANAIASIAANGTYTFYGVASTTLFRLRAQVGFIGSIDNVSVKEITYATNTPRIDFSNDAEGALLLEPQRLNNINKSNSITPLSYQSNVIKAENSGVSPDGSNNAMSITANSTNGVHRAGYAGGGNGSFSADDILTFSMFVKPNGVNYVAVGGFFGSENVVFDLINGTVVSESANVLGSKIQSLTNGWFRVSSTYEFQNTIGSGLPYAGVLLMQNSTSQGSWTGNDVDGILAYGFQLEEGSYSTSYIPTNGTPNTRLGEVCSDSGNSSFINSEEGVLYAEIQGLTDSAANRFISLGDGTSSNSIGLYLNSNSGKISVEVRRNGGSNEYIETTSVLQTDMNKIAVKYKDNDYQLWANGVKVAFSTTALVPTTLSTISFKPQAALSSRFYGKTKSLQVFSEALSDAELQTLTTI